MSILPIVVQGVRGDSVLTAGLLTIPQAMATGLTLQVATRAIDRTNPRRIVLTGVTLGALGPVLLALTRHRQRALPGDRRRRGRARDRLGATLLPTMTIATRDLEGAQTPDGTTLLALLQQLASAPLGGS